MAKLSQDNRTGSLATPLAKDVLALVSFNGSEGLSEPFVFHVEAISEDPKVDFDKVIGKQCTVKLKLYGRVREFSGILVEALSMGRNHDKLYGYRLTLRPWLWLLTRTIDYRIFQDKTVPDIIKKVFSDRGFADFEVKLTGSYQPREYCVQYRETDFDFVSRLMEEEGIFYYFKHSGDIHTLVLVDSNSSCDLIPGLAKVPYVPVVGEYSRKDEYLYHWESGRQFRTGRFEFNDYNYETPNVKLLSEAKASERYNRADMEQYAYPGRYKQKSVGERFVKIALEAEQSLDYRRQGSGEAPSIFSGGRTKLDKHFVDDENIEYLVVHAAHSYGNQLYHTGAVATREAYQGNYEFQPCDRPFRAPIVTPKPRVYGIQTAVVVDKQARGRVDRSPEEIEVEKLTEIYVSFYWDRRKHDEKRSCKLRVAQVWSGKNWGGQFIPRIGMEVVVEFVEGDPDQPLIVGSVYNDNNQPPYDLPGQKTISGIKSDSTKGGQGYNSWNFEDKKGGEQINVHAQKDLNVDVLNDETRTTNHDLTTTVVHKETRKVGTMFTPPKGSASRETTIVMGDDNLTITTGDHNILIPVGSQSTTALLSIKLMVGPSMVTITPASISLMSPLIDLTAMATINLTAPVINITGVVNLTGMLNITGGITVNTMVPVLVPA